MLLPKKYILNVHVLVTKQIKIDQINAKLNSIISMIAG